jgi:predicted Co/Zn/Cd cation transporter (cation efflux family)
MTGIDMFEVFLALFVGGRCLLEGIFYKKTARKNLLVLRDEYRYGMWRVRAFYVLLGLLLLALAVVFAIIVSTHSPLLLR